MRKIVLWGHTVEDYREMFDLSEQDLQGSILEYASGPNVFNRMQTEAQNPVLSCDPLFILDKQILLAKVSLIFEGMVHEMSFLQEHYDFSEYGGFDALVKKRGAALQDFFADYTRGKIEKRYLPIVEKELPFADNSFDLALVSHYLFAELDNQTVDFHSALIRDLAGVAKEVRIFPLIDRYGNSSEFLGPVLLDLQQANFGVEVREVDYHLYQSGNAMLRVWAQECPL